MCELYRLVGYAFVFSDNLRKIIEQNGIERVFRDLRDGVTLESCGYYTSWIET